MFKVLVIGAGPVGLYLAHALSAANINYTVLEAHSDVIRHEGAGLVLWPQTTRLLHQMGLYEKLKRASFSLNDKTNLLQNGYIISEMPLWTKLHQRHGYPAMGLSRGQFLEILYEALPHSQETVRTGCRVVDLQITANGVTAVLQDGRTEEASIVIGSDGVWSKTKEALQQLNTELDTEMFSTRINFQGLYGKAPAMSGVKPGTFYETRSNGIATQVVGSEGTMLFSLIQTVDTSTPVPRKYTLEDREAMASRFAEVQVAPGVRFKDVWRIAERETATMVNQEEGYAANWHHGRLVIVGDAAHKMTSISGLGLNTGLHSAAVLVNQLHDIHRLNKDPPAFLIEDAFATYYNIRQSETYSAFRLGQSLTRNVTWSSWADWIWDRFIMPWLNQDYIICDRISPLVSRGQLLSYVPFQELKGVVPWQSQSKERY